MEESMSPLESRAWLQLWAMGPPYLVYFGLQLARPEWFERLNLIQRLACFGATALTHAAITLIGLLMLKMRERGEHLLADERDRAIEGRATLSAYLVLMAGVVLVGVILPFYQPGWTVVNTALFFIVAAEMLRHLLIALAYGRAKRFAH
jgi:hypothetical protein